jgi:type I restriction enzyme S subunit
MPEKGWLCGTGSILFRPKKAKSDSEYLMTYLQSNLVKKYLEFVSVGSTMDNLNTEILSKMKVALPPSEERCAILKHLIEVETGFQIITTIEEKSIFVLQEFKQTLIAHAVTGKIKV